MRLLSDHKDKLVFILFILLWLPLVANAESNVNDSDALRGVTETKAVFDIHVSKPETLELYLQVIRQTHDDLKRQGQNPVLVVAFRGPTLRLITSENWSFSEEDQDLIEKSAALIKELLSLGVKFEACSIAAKLFKVDPNSYLPGIKPVGNTFVSLIGYQAQGYGLVPVD